MARNKFIGMSKQQREDFWLNLVTLYLHSDLGRHQFLKEHEVSSSAFDRWYKKLKPQIIKDNVTNIPTKFKYKDGSYQVVNNNNNHNGNNNENDNSLNKDNDNESDEECLQNFIDEMDESHFDNLDDETAYIDDLLYKEGVKENVINACIELQLPSKHIIRFNDMASLSRVMQVIQAIKIEESEFLE